MATPEDAVREHVERPAWIRLVRSPWPRLAVFAVLLGGLGWFALEHGLATVDSLRDGATAMGVLGVAVYVLGYALATVALLPAAVLTAAAGVLFGPVLGVVVVWSGAMLGAVGSFLLGRVLSRAAVEQLAGARVERLNAFLSSRGTLSVLLVRLLPLFPFALVNYGSAVTAVTLRQYVVGTALGILPGTVAYVALGGSLTEPTSPVFLTSVAALVALAVGGGVAARWHHRRANTLGEATRNTETEGRR